MIHKTTHPGVSLYVDVEDDLRSPVGSRRAKPFVCKFCRWVYLLRDTAWEMCSNPDCGWSIAQAMDGDMPLDELTGPVGSILLAAYAVGGTQAVIDIMNAEGEGRL